MGDKDKLLACQIYVDYIMTACEGMGAMGSMMFSDEKRIELHNKLLEAFGLKESDKWLICPLTDNLTMFKFSPDELKRQVERIIELEKN